MLTALTHHKTVFSACAEVVPFALVGRFTTESILRVRGGSSWYACATYLHREYSPRARR